MTCILQLPLPKKGYLTSSPLRQTLSRQFCDHIFAIRSTRKIIEMVCPIKFSNAVLCFRKNNPQSLDTNLISISKLQLELVKR
jgi:hypothetical protein